jgi:hypothetical protein
MLLSSHTVGGSELLRKPILIGDPIVMGGNIWVYLGL